MRHGKLKNKILTNGFTGQILLSLFFQKSPQQNLLGEPGVMDKVLIIEFLAEKIVCKNIIR